MYSVYECYSTSSICHPHLILITTSPSNQKPLLCTKGRGQIRCWCTKASTELSPACLQPYTQNAGVLLPLNTHVLWFGARKVKWVVQSPEELLQTTTKSGAEAAYAAWMQTSVCLPNGLRGHGGQRVDNLAAVGWSPPPRHRWLTPTVLPSTILFPTSSIPDELWWLTVSVGLDLLS